MTKKKKRKNKKMKKHYKIRNLTMVEVMLALSILYFIIIFSYLLVVSLEQTRKTEMLYEGETIVDTLIYPKYKSVGMVPSIGLQKEVAFIVNNRVDKEKLKNFAKLDYQQIKRLVGAKNDFCIYFEDENGNLIDISEYTGKEGIGIGSPDIDYIILDESGEVVEVVKCS